MKQHILTRPLTTFVLAAAMILTMGLFGTVYADSGQDKNIRWNFDDSTSTLTVDVVDEYADASDRCINYKSGEAPWYDYEGYITKIEVLDGVYGINGQSFSNLWALEEVDLADSVKEITGEAFNWDFSLARVKQPSGVCEIRSVHNKYPFDGCEESVLTFYVPGDSFMAECCKHHGLKIYNEKGSLLGAKIKESWIGDPLLPEDPADGYWYFAKEKWTGKAIKAVPTVRLYGKKLTNGKDFTCTWTKNINVGQAKVTIKGKGDYCDSTVSYFIIYPKSTSISKVTAGKKKLTVKWLKQDKKMSKKRIDGYQIQVATNKSFSKNKKTVNVKGYKTTSKTIKSLKSGKTYFVRVRTYMKSGLETKLYSEWSKAKKANVK